ncbi:tRNA (N6-isopentenyl adenosine(37)-C2)-methylthiotransferase MiaB [Brevibacillus sp. 7WMA2]|uniref:tRNA-2-methylthio-N(6)-dimethylallyladenosine synthase n=1 Tax=Brevibacillus laterosporus LMG 15441 TaxID=1042163 RepID=A0A075R878_BRELA|nr:MULTISPECIES: tRNA (N6-isopentenyl adenosine(37)-C2)-methylthiotransferase MiaB [Brevibacillus]AIG27493.1 (dimethylallyl)adenosine tRNA methylthiotransferase MiaB [Brevibacillus laterosporus LMG 15441]AYK08772.1 tRNA (N6-isopentenyl adenosine(37)-C2)-methylthiotransferase MiaB [Brevibacillus laterosporus]ERM19607.1 (dimethylallyl)adenosine tRNA methylthiotransferase [Brevibacillus laterosporus PE36]MBA4532407.1 tRNA (N6-isopentenyl adenosine(37)-C2)-methylthiotransferase MiaB [Brevibacillus 
MIDKKEATTDLKSGKSSKSTADYAKYFQAPSLKDAKKRGKEDITVHYDFTIPEEMKQIGKGLHYLIRTYGCQMNEHDTETMAGIFEAMGYTATEDTMEADVILFNTCAIREGAEDKVFGELGHMKHLKRNNPNLILGLCGCMSQEEKVVNKVLRSYSEVDMIFGTHNIHRLPVLLRDAMFSKEMVIEVWSKEGDIIENMPKTRTGDIKAWVNIMYGCDKFCTYCIVPYTRGKERSRRPEDVVAEVRELARQGFKEIMVLGQNVNAYGKDFEDRKYGLGDLLDELRKIDIPRIRFTTSHPRDFDDHLIEVLAKGGNLVEQIHLPAQSGSSEVLKKMARKYTREHYMELVRKIKAAIPDVSLSTDIIVGFPGETEEQFQETLSLMKEVEYDSAYTFIYSPREGTPAASMVDNVPEEVKKDRLQRLMAVQNEISLRKNQEMVGKTYELLIEGESRKNPEVLAGRTRTGKLVHVKADKSLIGTLVHVTITEAKTFTTYGELVTKVEV